MRSVRVGACVLAAGGLVAAVAVGPTILAGALSGALHTRPKSPPVAGPAGWDAGCIDRVLATMRTIESGDYQRPPGAGGAAGAYQMIDSTWRAYAVGAGFDPGPWPHASDAPAAMQDAAAAWKVRQVLGSLPVEQIPPIWYVGHPIPDPAAAEWDVVPMPEAGNVLTPRQYQSRWVGELDRRGGCTPVAAPRPAPAGDLNVTEPAFAGYPNGDLPEDLLIEVQPGARLVPAAATAWQAMAAAAERDGLTLTITSAYRSLADQARIIDLVGILGAGGLAAPVGTSPHGLGISTDVDVRTDPRVLPWLTANAARWCYANAVGAQARAMGEQWHYQWYGAATGCVAEG